MLFKTVPFECKIKSDGDGRTIEGYASTFGGDPDSYGDIIAKGAFKKTISERKDKIKVLWQHRSDIPIGRPIVIQEDSTGLYTESRISDTKAGNDALTLIRDGVVDKFSIGYETKKSDWDEDRQIRTLKEIKLYEYSPVTFPANENADITGMKHSEEFDSLTRKLDSICNRLDSIEEKGATMFQDFPLASRDYNWNSDAAVKRVRSYFQVSEEANQNYRKAFMWFDMDNWKNLTAYKLPFVDVIDGALYAVPKAIFAIAAVLQGARGGVAISANDEAKVKRHVERYYAKMRTVFEDESLVAPWKKGKSVIQIFDSEDLESVKNIFEKYGVPYNALFISEEPEVSTLIDDEPQEEKVDPDEIQSAAERILNIIKPDGEV